MHPKLSLLWKTLDHWNMSVGVKHITMYIGSTEEWFMVTELWNVIYSI